MKNFPDDDDGVTEFQEQLTNICAVGWNRKIYQWVDEKVEVVEC